MTGTPPKHKTLRHAVRLPAFFAALILAPLIPALLGFPLLIPYVALYMGGPFYLLLGGPTLYWMLSREPRSAWQTATAALVVNTLACIPILLAALFIGTKDLRSIASVYFTYGAMFSMLWGGLFGLLYNFFTRKSRRAAIPPS
ncbi:hypothetical protein LZG00_17025 [Rhodobacteraceae bacterium LMO-12]|nr:hypothetical protein [Rhodobacteraceae bacterium LMO-JJ12]